jgi:hypothetical protein
MYGMKTRGLPGTLAPMYQELQVERKHPASTVAGSDQAAAAWGWEIFQCQGSSSCNLAAG